MNNIDIIARVEKYVSEHIADFHEARINKLKKLKIDEILRRKNPYLFKAKNLEDPCILVESLMDAVCSSSEETLFGDWLEKLAIYVAGEVYGGAKSTTKGVDLEMDKDDVHYGQVLFDNEEKENVYLCNQLDGLKYKEYLKKMIKKSR